MGLLLAVAALLAAAAVAARLPLAVAVRARWLAKTEYYGVANSCISCCPTKKTFHESLQFSPAVAARLCMELIACLLHCRMCTYLPFTLLR